MASALIPPYPKSDLIAAVRFSKCRFHKGDGDMWPITWADDDNLYGGAGDKGLLGPIRHIPALFPHEVHERGRAPNGDGIIRHIR